MIYRDVRRFNVNLPVVTFGGAAISGEGGGYGFGAISEQESEKLIRTAWDQGLTLFDTAPIYGFGLSEERLGKYLPKDAMIISKSGVDWHESKRVNMANSKSVTEKMLEKSLKRLNREFIDIYMIHWPDQKVDIREPLEVLQKAKGEGKIKHIGLCNTNLSDLGKANEICQIDCLQSEFNLFNQSGFLNLGDEWKKYFSMGWGTFDKGILTGRVTQDRKFSKEDCRSWAPWWNKKEVDLKVKRTKFLTELLTDYNLNLASFCIEYSINFFGLSTCLIGFKSQEDIFEVNLNLHKSIKPEIIKEVLNRWNHQ